MQATPQNMVVIYMIEATAPRKCYLHHHEKNKNLYNHEPDSLLHTMMATIFLQSNMIESHGTT